MTTTTSPAQERKIRLFCAALDTYPPFRVDVVELFDKALAARGYRIDWAMWREEPGPGGIERWADRTYVLGSRSARTGLGGAIWRALAWIPFAVRFVRQLRAGHYDIVQARDTPVFAWPMLFLARLSGARFTYWMSYPIAESRLFRATDPAESMNRVKRVFLAPFGRLSTWILYRLVLPRADLIFVQSKRMAADVIAKGVDHKRITPVPMTVDLDDLTRTSANGPDPFLGRKVLVHLGTLLRVRRPEFMIDVLVEVRKRVPDALLVLIGDAPEPDMDFLRTYAAQAGLERHVIFTGRLAREHALKLARHGAVCLSPFPPHPLNDSTTPTKLVEYLALGRPVVVNDHPDQTSVVEESGAGLSVPYDVGRFAEAVVGLLLDPARAEAMGARGPAFVRETRTTEALALRIDEAYRALLRQANGAPLAT